MKTIDDQNKHSLKLLMLFLSVMMIAVTAALIRVVIKHPVKKTETHPVIGQSYDGITFEVDAFDQSTGYITVSFTNHLAMEVNMATYFLLQKKEDGDWVTVEHKVPELTCDAMILPPEEKVSVTASLDRDFYLTGSGTYRIIKPVADGYAFTEFTME